MRFFPQTRAGRPRELQTGLLCLGAFCVLLLSGCGGGGGINGTSTSDQGFRIVPAGGNVIPLNSGGNSVTLAVPANAVSAGVGVSASVLPDVAATGQSVPSYLQSAPTGTSTTALIAAYQINFNPDNPTIAATLPIPLTLSYANIPKDGAGNAFDPSTTFRLYYFDSGSKTWTALPDNAVQVGANSTGTVTATLGTINTGTVTANNPAVLPNLKSGVYAIFATEAPTPPTL